MTNESAAAAKSPRGAAPLRSDAPVDTRATWRNVFKQIQCCPDPTDKVVDFLNS